MSKNRDLEIPVKSQSRSLKVAPFGRPCMVSYYCSIVTLSLKRVVLRYSTSNMPWPWKQGYGPTRSLKMSRSIERTWLPVPQQQWAYLVPFPRYTAISVENREKKFPTPLVFCAAAEGVPLGIGYRRWGQRTKMMGYRANKEVWRYLQPCG